MELRRWTLSPAALAGLLLTACSGAVANEGGAPACGAPVDRPNMVVIVVDDLRWDEFGLAGHPYAETPNIGRLSLEALGLGGGER